MPTRRTFLASAVQATAVGPLLGQTPAAPGKLPAVIATWPFGQKATTAAGKILADGGPLLDAVEKGINAVELDPTIDSVGYGGLPNAEGVVQLDAVLMYGPRHAAGAVASLEGIPTPISVARKVLERGKPTLLVGPGAQAFALQNGFQKQDLLTPHSRQKWEEWKAKAGRAPGTHDTVGVVAIDDKGDVAAGCSTSGLAFKLPGRVGDSPIIGAGAYCDNAVGGAAATGNGDLMMRYCLSFLTVELMRLGLSPMEACAAALRRMLTHGHETDAALVALNKHGEFGAAKIGQKEFPYAVWNRDTNEVRKITAAVG